MRATDGVSPIDPTVALAELRALIFAAQKLINGRPADDEFQAVIDQFDALDEWLSKGGMLPEQWARNRRS